MTTQPCSADEEAEAKALVLPVELQAILPVNSNWAFVLDDNGDRIGALMWERGSYIPTDIEIAPTLMDNDYPNQNLYWGVQ